MVLFFIGDYSSLRQYLSTAATRRRVHSKQGW